MMKMSNNPAKYEALIKQCLRSILDVSVRSNFLSDVHMLNVESNLASNLFGEFFFHRIMDVTSIITLYIPLTFKRETLLEHKRPPPPSPRLDVKPPSSYLLERKPLSFHFEFFEQHNITRGLYSEFHGL